MATILENCQPAEVFFWFEALTRIPHGSGHTGAISAFCVDFATARGLRYRRDHANNVVIWKNATPGYEDHAPVIVQGHLDMVCDKVPGSRFNFQTDPLRLRVDGDYLYAEETTLGGDDGIAVAYALALLDSKAIPHPPLEVLLTTDEEIGMLGAAELDASDLQGRVLLNIDSEEEGIFTVSCAGGCTATIAVPFQAAPASGILLRLEVDGLTGGHSGTEIHKGRANACKLLGEALALLSAVVKLRLADLRGGSKDNAIARSAAALIVVPSAEVGRLDAVIEAMEQEFRERFAAVEPNLRLTCRESNEGVAEIWDEASTTRILRLLCEVPCGVQTMSRDIEGLVETSLNLGVMKPVGDVLRLTFCVRSSVNRDKDYLVATLRAMAEVYGGVFLQTGDYPAWEYRQDSPLRELMCQTFARLRGHAPQVMAIHAGLECGLLSGKLPGLDCVSFGPDLEEIHTTRERMSLSSVARTWEFLLELLRQL